MIVLSSLASYHSRGKEPFTHSNGVGLRFANPTYESVGRKFESSRARFLSPLIRRLSAVGRTGVEGVIGR